MLCAIDVQLNDLVDKKFIPIASSVIIKKNLEDCCEYCLQKSSSLDLCTCQPNIDVFYKAQILSVSISDLSTFSYETSSGKCLFKDVLSTVRTSRFWNRSLVNKDSKSFPFEIDPFITRYIKDDHMLEYFLSLGKS